MNSPSFFNQLIMCMDNCMRNGKKNFKIAEAFFFAAKALGCENINFPQFNLLILLTRLNVISEQL